jgi:predicted DNA-binding transcriptional regulator YafY
MKLERLMAITIILLNRKRVQAHELADQLQVSLRTIYRDLESLNLSGIPIVSYTGAEGGFEIMESFRLDRQLLSYDELKSLALALQGLHSTGIINEDNMDRLMDKVGALIVQVEQGRTTDKDRTRIDFSPWKNDEADRAKFDLLRKTIQENRIVTFTYVDGKGEVTKDRSVEPMELILKGYVWYLYGYCLKRDDYRTFKLSRIMELKVLLESFELRTAKPPSLKQAYEMPEAEGVVNLVLRFQGEAIASAVDHFKDHELEWQSGDSLIVRTSLPDQTWIIGFLLHFKTELVVIEPPALARKLRDTALSIASIYSDLFKVDN